MFQALQSCFGSLTRSKHLIKMIDLFCLLLSGQPSSHTAVYGSWPHIPQPTRKDHVFGSQPWQATWKLLGGRQVGRGVHLSQLALPSTFPKLLQIQSLCVWKTAALISSGTPQDAELICASRLDFAENGRWHPTPSGVPRVWLVYVIPRQLAHSGTLWDHHRSWWMVPWLSGGCAICITICALMLWGRSSL
jgi:hypothetical protein